MGGKSGGGGKTPVEGKNTAKSGQRYTSVHAIAEGVLAGFGNGDQLPMKSVYLNDTPIQNPDGSFNFKGVEIFAMPGTLDQSNVPGFDTTERAVGVSTEVKKGTPVIRTIVDSTVDALRVTVGVNMNSQTKDNGDTVAASTSMLVELLNKDGTKATKTVTFTEKSGGMYQLDVVFDELPPVPFSVRVSRVSADSASSRLINNTYFSSYVEIVTAKLSYPHTALLCLKVDSEQFGGQVPRVNVLYKAKLIKVPSNYNPETRTYSSPIWDGSFKEAWTNNPAWWIYDFLTQPRYSGLAKRLNAADVDKWAFYEIGKYCDEPVDDGYGGKEPRFTFNAYMTEERAAADVLNDLASCFRGMAYWNGQQHTATLDRNSDPVALYNNSNVVDGLFTYSGVARKSIHTAVLVQYTDKTNGYRTATEYVSDDAAVRRYGLNVKNITAFGCDSRGQAYRIGKWLLHTELTQQETISFSVGREGLRHLPNDIVQVLDNDRVGAMVGGRVLAVDGTIVTLDRAIDAVAGNVVGGKLLFKGATGVSVESVIAAQPSSSILRLQTAPAGMAEMTEWAFIGKVKPVLYRCVAITENTDEGTYTINALLHDPNKEAVVDGSAVFDKEITTLHTIEPQVIDGSLTVSDGGVDFTWGSKITAGAAVFYNVEVWRNNTLYRSFFGLKDPNVRLDNLPNGNYEIRVYAINTGGQKSEPLIKAFSIDYTVTGLRAKPQMFAINLVWTLPQTVVSNIHTEVWYATTNNIASATKLASVPYPQSEYTLANVALADRFWFWVRIVDAAGNTGEFSTSVYARCDTDPSPIVQLVGDTIQSSVLGSQQIADLSTSVGQAVGVATTANSNSLVASSTATTANNTANTANNTANTANSTATTANNKANTAFDLANEVSRGVGVGRNLILNPLFDTLENWSSKGWNTTNYPNWINYQHSVYSYALKDTPVFMFRHNINGDSGQILLDSELVDISEGKHYQASAYVAGWNLLSGVRVMVYFFDPQDNQVLATGYPVDVRSSFPNSGSRAPASHGYSDINRFQPIQVNVTAPLGAVRAKLRFQFQFQASETKDKYGMLTRPQLCEIPNTLTNMALFSAGESSSYTLKVGGYWNGKPVSTGFSMGVMGEETNFMIDAKNFVVGSLEDGKFKAPFIISGGNAYINGDVIATGTILGNHIAANQSISAPIIEGGSLDIGNGAAVINSDGSAYFNNATFKGHVEATSGTFNGTISADKIVGDVMTVHRMSQVGGGQFTVSIPKSSRPRLVEAPLFKLQHSSRPENPYRGEVPAYSFRLNGSVLCSSPSYTLPNGGQEGSTHSDRVRITSGWFAIPANTNAYLSCNFGPGGYVLSPEQLVDIGYPTLQVAYMSENDPTYSANLGSQVWTNLPDRYLTVEGIFAPTSSGLTAKYRGTRYVALPYNIKGIRFTYHGSDYAGNRKWSSSDVNLHLTNPQQTILIMDFVPEADTLYTKTFDNIQFAAILSPVGNSGNTITIKNVQVLTYSGRDFNTDP